MLHRCGTSPHAELKCYALPVEYQVPFDLERPGQFPPMQQNHTMPGLKVENIERNYFPHLGTLNGSCTKPTMHFVHCGLYSKVGLGTEVIALPTVILTAETVHSLSQCDVLFGCLDSIDGRMHLNQISTFYSIPYIDLGVTLKASAGKIKEINGAIRFVMPGGSSLLSRHAYSLLSQHLAANSGIVFIFNTINKRFNQTVRSFNIN